MPESINSASPLEWDRLSPYNRARASYRHLIGIMGPAGSGKDTVADYLVWRYGYVKYSLADPIKAGLVAMIDELTPEHFTDRDLKEQKLVSMDTTPRKLAQTLGTEWGRVLISEHIWLRQAVAFVEQSEHPVVIADIRFQNEASFIEEMLGTIIKIERNVPGVSSHASEEQELHFDKVISNNADIVSLLKNVEALLGPTGAKSSS